MITNTALRKAMHEIAAKKGDFTLFALFRRSDAPGRIEMVRPTKHCTRLPLDQGAAAGERRRCGSSCLLAQEAGNIVDRDDQAFSSNEL